MLSRFEILLLILLTLGHARLAKADVLENSRSLISLSVDEVASPEGLKLKICAPIFSSGFPTTIDGVETHLIGKDLQVIMEGHLFGPFHWPWSTLKADCLVEVPPNVAVVTFGNDHDCIWIRSISHATERQVGPLDRLKYQIGQLPGNANPDDVVGDLLSTDLVFSRKEVRMLGKKMILLLYIKPVKPEDAIAVSQSHYFSACHHFYFRLNMSSEPDEIVMGSDGKVLWQRPSVKAFY